MTVAESHRSAAGVRRRRRPRLEVSRKFWARMVVWGSLVVIWQVIAASLGPELFPSLGSVLIHGVPEALDQGYGSVLMTTLGQLLTGFGIACGIGIPLGALMGSSTIWNNLIQPYAYGLYVTPREALVPLLIIIFGTALNFKIVVIVIFAAFFPLVNTAQGVATVAKGPLAEMSRSICTSKLKFFTSILLPGALPNVVAGLRLGLGMAFNGIVIAELWTAVGVGGALTTLAGYRELPMYFALSGMVAVLAVASYALMGAAESWMRCRFGQVEAR